VTRLLLASLPFLVALAACVLLGLVVAPAWVTSVGMLVGGAGMLGSMYAWEVLR
jgi:hypothetical protein